MRFRITERCFIQPYGNTKKDLFSYSLILAGSRVFGRDCDGGEWHRHPVENPELHDVTEEGRKAAAFKDFLEEVHEILRRLKLV